MKRIRKRIVAPAPAFPAALGLAIIAAFAGAHAQSPAPPSPGAAAADPAVEAARAAFEALPEPDRKATQDSLVWTGDYSGIVDGGFGRQTFAAITSYQRRTKRAPNGILDDRSRADLRMTAQQSREATGFAPVDDPLSGARIGVPARLLTRREANPNGGSRWQSADGKVTLDTRSLPAPEGGLQALYDRNLAIQTPGRHVTYKAIRSDFFVIAGETPTGRFYTRYASSGTTIRGFSIGYDKSLAREVDPLIVAIANSFRPFPPGAPAPVAAPPAGALPVRAAERLLGTGVALAPRRVVTTASVSACSGLRAAGAKPLQVRTVQGLTILDLVEDLKTAPLRMPAGPMGSGEPLLVLSYRLQGTRAELVATPALGGDEEGSVVAPLQAGAQGAPVVDRSGALRGLVRGGPDERRAVAGIVPPAHYRIESAAVSGLVATQDAPAGDPHPRTAADLVSSLRDAVVPITCDP